MHTSDGLVLLSALLLLLLATFQVVCTVGYRRGAHRRAEMEERAAALLRDVLTVEEYRQLTTSGYLAVPSPTVANRIYRVPARGHPVAVYESGKLIQRLCLQPVKPLPAADMVVLHKLMIEGNEQEYLRTATVLTQMQWPRTRGFWW